MSEPLWKEHLPQEPGEPFTWLDGDPPRPGLWWLPEQPEILEHWVPILSNNFSYLTQLIEETGDAGRARRAAEARGVFESLLHGLRKGRGLDVIPTIHHVTLYRENLVRRFDLGDAYADVKRRETEAAVERLVSDPQTFGLPPRAAGGSPLPGGTLDLLAQILSGNLFDLGSATTQKAFREGTMNLAEAFDEMRRRIVETYPGLPDEIDSLGWKRWMNAGERGDGGVLVFVDNAGADFVLGVLPLAARLATEFKSVTLAANTYPSSNDMTVDEVRDALGDIRRRLPGCGLDDIDVVGTGTGTPGIDLARVGPGLNEAARRASALVLEGQGRGVETTWAARLRIPVVRVAVLKDPRVAGAIHRGLWQPLMEKRDPGGGAP